MALAITNAAKRFAGLLGKYASNPVDVKSAPAIGSSMATARKTNPRKKKRSAKQIAATKKMLAANRKKRRPAKKASRKHTKKRSTAKKRAVKRTTTKKATRRRPVRRKKKMAAKRKTTRRRNPVRRRVTKSSTALRTNPRRRRRKAPTRRRRRRNPATTTPARSAVARRRPTRKANPWHGQPRKHARAAKLGWSRRRRRTRCKTKYSRPYKTRGVYRRNPRRLAQNPATTSSLTQTLMGHQSATNARLANPIKTNPLNTGVLTSLAVTGAGLGFGLVVADLVDRYVATRTPPQTKDGQGGKHPWYGRNAALAYQRRPDAMRLGIQGAGAVASLALTGMTRKMPVVPFLMAGTTLAFAGNLFSQLFRWWIMPKIFKVEKDGEESLANRIAPLEQDKVQERVDELMDNYMSITDLAANQQETPGIQSPLSISGQHVLSLGRGQREEGSSPLAEAGHVGSCAQCGGQGGCYPACPGLDPNACDQCPPFPDGQPAGEGISLDLAPLPGGPAIPAVPPQMVQPPVAYPPVDMPPVITPSGEPIPPEALPPEEEIPVGIPRPSCEYVVQEGDDLYALAEEAGIDVNDVFAMNGGGNLFDFWDTGATVKLPYSLCRLVAQRPTTSTQAVDESGAVVRGVPQFVVPNSFHSVAGVEAQKEATLFSLGFVDDEDDY